jgi:aminomethyltransferase
VRGGAAVFPAEDAAEPIGAVTSGCFGPSLNAPVAMGYVAAGYAAIGSRLYAEVRGQRLPVTVSALPFITPNYLR